VEAVLYSLVPSHPARAAGLMLRHKGIEHKVVNLPPGSQPLALRALGFRGGTVPAMKLDGRRVQGSLQISRALEELKPTPPLFPGDPAARAAVEEAERWGEAVYQPVPRRIFRWALARDGDLRAQLARQSQVPLPGINARLTGPVAYAFARAAGADEEAVEADVKALPEHLDRVDGLIADGVIGGSELNAADFQIATTTRVLLNMPPLAPILRDRPAAEHAFRVVPKFGGEVPLRVPPEWVPA
jgi:glutathione S-transferase